MSRQQHCDLKAIEEQDALNWFVRYKLKNEGVQILTTESPDISYSFDNWIASGSTEFIAEVKVRKDVTGNQIDKWGGPILEGLKLSGMVAYKEKYSHDNEMLYINFFKDEMRIYKLRKDPTYYSWYLKKLPKDNYDKQLVWKWVTDLPKEDLVESIKYRKK